MLLGVNIDHIAVLREARAINDPDPLDAISIVKRSKASQITIHLREDRRHIHDLDAKNIIDNSHLPINLECSINSEIVKIVCNLKPHRATLVPEKREEVTTEGGLDLVKYREELKEVIERLNQNKIEVSLFIDPNIEIIKVAKELNVPLIELHTGTFANIYAMLYTNLSKTKHSIKSLELDRDELKNLLDKSLFELQEASKFANSLGIKVAAGHGLNYQNVKLILDIKEIFELNIGQSIIARSIFVGLKSAIDEMVDLIK